MLEKFLHNTHAVFYYAGVYNAVQLRREKRDQERLVQRKN